jgi:hypothetical protein
MRDRSAALSVSVMVHRVVVLLFVTVVRMVAEWQHSASFGVL